METATSYSEIHSAFMQLNGQELQEARSRERQKYQDYKPNSFETLFFLKAIQDMQSMRVEYEDGLIYLDSLELWDGREGLKEQAFSHLLTGLKQQLYMEKYLQLALEKSVKEAVTYIKWLEQDNISFADNIQEAFRRFEAMRGAGGGGGGSSLLFGSGLSALEDWNGGKTGEVRFENGLKTEEVTWSVYLKTEDSYASQQNGGSAKFTLDSDGDQEGGSANSIGMMKRESSIPEVTASFLTTSPSLPSQQQQQQSSVKVVPRLKPIKVVARPRPKPHTCSHCGKAFAIKLNHTLHVRTHAKKAKRFECDICNKTFSYKGSLVTHNAALHSGKRYPCLECDMKFKSKVVLVRHMWRTHHMLIKQEDLRNKECVTCNKKFYTQEDLDKHALLHTDAFKCDLCQKTFNAPHFLERHLKIHREKDGGGADLSTTEDGGEGDSNSISLDDKETAAIAADAEGIHEPEASKPENGMDYLSHVQPSDLGPAPTAASFVADIVSGVVEEQVIVEEEVAVSTDPPPLDLPKLSYYKLAPKQFKCSFCDKMFKTRCKRKEHERSHTGEKPFKCEICFKAFAYKTSLKDHYATHAFMDCPICGVAFTSKVQLARHMKSEHDANHEYNAEMDNQSDILDKVDQFKASMAVEGEEEKAAEAAALAKEQKSFSCEYCGRTFNLRWKLTYHIRSHTGEKPFVCDVCSKSFAKKSSLKDHYELHTDVSHACPNCGKTFNTKAQMKRHLKDRCNLAEPEKCEFCIRKFKSKKSLEYHMLIHAEDKAFVCDVCEKAFHDTVSLTRHKKANHEKVIVKTEDGHEIEEPKVKKAKPEKKHMCSECGKCFASKTKWNYHMNIHTGERPYKCKVCSKAFTSSIALYTHKDIHTDEKFPCNVCGKIFNTWACQYRHNKKMHKDINKSVKTTQDAGR